MASPSLPQSNFEERTETQTKWIPAHNCAAQNGVLHMKKILLASVAIVAFAGSASAFEFISTGSADFAGLSGTALSGDVVATFGDSVGSDLVVTNTDPLFATANAALSQDTGGLGTSTNLLQGQLVQNGATNTAADVNVLDLAEEAASTTTEATGNLLGAATGGITQVTGALGASSDEQSSSVDFPFGGSDEASATQTVGVSVQAVAADLGLGTSLSQTEVSGDSESESTTDE